MNLNRSFKPGQPGDELGEQEEKPLDPQTCHYPRGSVGRLDTYRRREAQGYAIFNPGDCRDWVERMQPPSGDDPMAYPLIPRQTEKE